MQTVKKLLLVSVAKQSELSSTWLRNLNNKSNIEIYLTV